MSPPRVRSRTPGALVGLALAALSVAIGGVHPSPAPGSIPPLPPPTLSASPPVSSSLPKTFYLPDPTLHPGAANPGLTQAQLCGPGFHTVTIRPPVSYTDHLKRLELGTGGTIIGPSGTAYKVTGEQLPGTVGDYELDHLISLELGGNPEDPANLWMQPWERHGARLAATGRGAESKDVIENRLHRSICAGKTTLTAAQKAIAADWTAVAPG